MKPHLPSVLIACAILTACTPAPPAPEAEFNRTDVMFLQMMIPHHEQGMAIAKLARDRKVHADLKTLAAAIGATQASETDTMAGWLRTWNQPSIAAAGEHAEHGGMPGTSPAEIAALSQANGAEFERRFLDTLIAHQDDAIQIAGLELAAGVNQSARELARRIERSRSAQIKQMLAFLGTPSPPRLGPEPDAFRSRKPAFVTGAATTCVSAQLMPDRC